METINVHTSQRDYGVLVGSGLLKEAGRLCGDGAGKKAAIVTDSKVGPLYAGALDNALREAGWEPCVFVFRQGERSKNMNTLGRLLEFLAASRLTRSDTVFALGGGVTGDLAGFAASVYLRGIPCVQLPTTLLAAIDSSVGGKTAVNLRAGKNLAGAFWQPERVICDCETFRTLDADTLADGMAEAVKYAMIRDRPLYDILMQGDFLTDAERCVARCVAIKADIVSRDERDNGERLLLNFGHTAGHAVERASGFNITHGRAVAIGMVMAARAADRLDLSDGNCAKPLVEALEKYGLPHTSPFDAETLARIALADKKRSGSNIRLVLPRTVGESFLHDLPVGNLAAFFRAGEE
ncbi:MAG TPA: 3-dehydroquinate synthase [Clostridiales bacterium]|nr:3-dehydroquinate synthase [Clostridiales bacterium]HQH63211.1 3-dehydroquinate synthase [Clostridiales bacterium]HQK74228.1 3-dehydroquinate synthase [Clostridiales bacterium]